MSDALASTRRLTSGFMISRRLLHARCVRLTVVVCWALMFATVPARAQQADEELPSGEAVYEKYLEVSGGRERKASVQSMVMKGNMEIANFKAPMVIQRARPNMFSLIIEYPQVGSRIQGTDGNHAWEVDPMQGARVLAGAEKEEMIRRADFDEELQVNEYYKSIENEGVKPWNGTECYVVNFTDKNGVEERRYFNRETGFMVGMESERETPLGKTKVRSSLSDVRDVLGMKMPFRNEITAMGVSTVLQFESVDVDVDIDPSEFAPPDVVAKLIEKKNARDTAAPAP